MAGLRRNKSLLPALPLRPLRMLLYVLRALSLPLPYQGKPVAGRSPLSWHRGAPRAQDTCYHRRGSIYALKSLD